jgi:hypothetical protein
MRASSAVVAFFLASGLAATPSHAQSAADDEVPVDLSQGDQYADTDPSSLTDFRPALDPYGSWVDDATYGTVWSPSTEEVGTGFQPYDTAGNWDYVDGDYVWVSNYAWGWVCFHYGRWAFSAGRWVWIPGRDYAGAWVSWRLGDDAYGYVGWAPLAPAWIWMEGRATALGLASPEPWVFSTYVEFLLPGVGSHLVTGNDAATMAAHTRPYVSAQPSVAAGPVSQHAPHGPPPAALGIDISRLALPALSAQEVRARQLARPSLAVSLGARPPARHVVQALPRPIAVPRGPTGGPHESARGRR